VSGLSDGASRCAWIDAFAAELAGVRENRQTTVVLQVFVSAARRASAFGLCWNNAVHYRILPPLA